MNYFANITYKPVNSFNLSMMPSFTTYDTELQYVDSYTYLNDDKYIFGNLDQKTFNLTIRVNYNITPDLSVQYYGSPFISSVLFNKFKISPIQKLMTISTDFMCIIQMKYLLKEE